MIFLPNMIHISLQSALFFSQLSFHFSCFLRHCCAHTLEYRVQRRGLCWERSSGKFGPIWWSNVRSNVGPPSLQSCPLGLHHGHHTSVSPRAGGTPLHHGHHSSVTSRAGGTPATHLWAGRTKERQWHFLEIKRYRAKKAQKAAVAFDSLSSSAILKWTGVEQSVMVNILAGSDLRQDRLRPGISLVINRQCMTVDKQKRCTNIGAKRKEIQTIFVFRWMI